MHTNVMLKNLLGASSIQSKPFSLPYLYFSNIYITFGILTVEFFDIVNLHEINNLVLQIELYLLLPFVALCVVKPYKME